MSHLQVLHFIADVPKKLDHLLQQQIIVAINKTLKLFSTVSIKLMTLTLGHFLHSRIFDGIRNFHFHF